MYWKTEPFILLFRQISFPKHISLCDLLRKEVSTAEEIEKKIRENAKKKEKRKMFENKVKAEIEEEEKKIIVIGFPFANSNKEATLPGLVAAMIREGVTPREGLSIEWMREEANGKKSIILLNATTMQNRDFILMNLKKDKGFIVKKSFPGRYM